MYIFAAGLSTLENLFQVKLFQPGSNYFLRDQSLLCCSFARIRELCTWGGLVPFLHELVKLMACFKQVTTMLNNSHS